MSGTDKPTSQEGGCRVLAPTWQVGSVHTRFHPQAEFDQVWLQSTERGPACPGLRWSHDIRSAVKTKRKISVY